MRGWTLAALLALLPVGDAGAAGGLESAPPAAVEEEGAVLGVSFRGTHRAYPLRIFARPRVVNDVVGRQEVAVFHDPERGLSAAWFRTVLGEPIEFSGEVAGAVAEDLTTITRWDMTTGQAVSGNLAGQRLVGLPVTATSWERWLARHPAAELFTSAEP